jgi:6-pyruvoyltetrahydropterin/6-carboxytetrahydropterin synthase
VGWHRSGFGFFTGGKNSSGDQGKGDTGELHGKKLRIRPILYIIKIFPSSDTGKMAISPQAMKARLTKDFRFEAAHTLPSLPEDHKCRQMHGHSFKVEISIEGEVDPAIGWIYDHKLISNAMNPLLEQLDHAYLNDIEGLESPTIEIMAGWFWKKLAPQLPGLAEIVIFETPTARCSFKGEF